MNGLGYAVQGEFLRVDDRLANDEEHANRLRVIEKLLVDAQNRAKKEFSALPARLDSTHSYTSVTAVGVHSEMGKRPNMEDDEIMVDAFNGNTKQVSSHLPRFLSLNRLALVCAMHQGFFGLHDFDDEVDCAASAVPDFVVKVMHLVRSA